MLKAYDAFLDSEVTADMAASEGVFEPYRYKCAHCGEKVRLAAVASTRMVSHFRHRNGNSDVECEYYLGQGNTLSTSEHFRRRKTDRVDFFFDFSTKMFCFGVKFSGDEISIYEQESAIIELRTKPDAHPFKKEFINNRNFTPDVLRTIPLEVFAQKYYYSNTFDIKKKQNHEVFNDNCNNKPTFFKMQGGDAGDKAKLISKRDVDDDINPVLYTGIPYLVVFQKEYWAPEDVQFPNDVLVSDSFRFETMGRKFLGKVLTINAKNQQTESLLNNWGYRLEASEMLTLLWPPAIFHDDVARVYSDTAYFYTTYELRAHGNINVSSNYIVKLADGLTQVSIKAKTRIYKKNTELVIEKHEFMLAEYDVVNVTQRESRKVDVLNENNYLFNCTGVSALSQGMSFLLTQGSEVRHYSYGYHDETIVAPRISSLSEEELLKDAMLYYRRKEVFKREAFESLNLSRVASDYITACEKSGWINVAVINLIKGGRL